MSTTLPSSSIYFGSIVAIVLQLADKLGGCEHFAIEDAVWRAIDPSAGLVHVARETLIDHAAVGDPVVNEDSGKDQHSAGRGADQRQAHTGKQELTTDAQLHSGYRFFLRTDTPFERIRCSLL
jgi:hypothetical protein